MANIKSPKIFISYRRKDSAYAALRIHEILSSTFGSDSTFLDVTTIPLGMDFPAYIKQEVENRDVLLVIIGDHWLKAEFSDGPFKGTPRLEAQTDLVRIEIETALNTNTMIIPILVGSADMPSASDLPQSISALSSLNAAELRPNPDFHHRMNHLIGQLEQAVNDKKMQTFELWLDDYIGQPDQNPVDFSKDAEPKGLFVGRDEEMKKLMVGLEEVAKGNPSSMFVKGEIGTGKTALVDNFIGEALRKYPDLLVVMGSAKAHTGRRDAYRLFRDIFLALCGESVGNLPLGEVGQVATARLKKNSGNIARLLVESAPDLVSSFVPLRSFLCAAAEADNGDPKWRQKVHHLKEAIETLNRTQDLQCEVLFSYVAKTLSGLLTQHKILIVLTDLHWADAATIELFSYLQNELQRSPVLFVSSYQSSGLIPFGEETRHPLEATISQAKRLFGDVMIDLDLEEYTDRRKFVDAILDAELNDLDEHFRDALVTHTSGNGLFTTELLNTLKNSGELTFDQEKGWQVDGAVNWDCLPPKIEGVVEERIERLEEEIREVLSIASVEGNVFCAEVLSRIQEIPERKLIRTIDRTLIKHHNLVFEANNVPAGRRWLSRFEFTHRAFQQYLYKDLSRAQRRAFHGDIAEILEDLYQEETSSVALPLARHFGLSGNDEKAVEYLIIAAQQNLQNCAYDEALKLVEEAGKKIECPQNTPTLALQLEMVRAAVLKAKIGWLAPEAIAAYDRAHDLCQQIGGRPRELSAVLFARWVAHLLRLQLNEGLEEAKRCVELGLELDDVDIQVQAHVAVGNTLFWMGNLDSAKKSMTEVMRLFPQEEAKEHLLKHGQDSRVFAGMFLCLIESLRGDTEASLSHTDDLQQLIDTLDHSFSTAIALQAFAWNCVHLRDVDGTKRHSQSLIDLCEQKGFPFYHAVGLIFGGWADAMLGSPTTGKEQMRDAFESRISLGGCIVFHSIYCLLLAEVLSLEGQKDEALEVIEKGLEIARNQNELVYESHLQNLKTKLSA